MTLGDGAQVRQARPRRATLHNLVAVAAVALLLGALFVPAEASHAQTVPGGQVVSFTQVSGNEWWVQVRMGGADGASASSVRAMDTGGPWIGLKAQTWTSD